ncbi:unnamed protein product [Euphydryas editha]|uniref:Uncharacterized protein n=1 Tax=Euphydryas editha TaxID=104508 RepID=A0AAU9VEY7_EUPED|nr:unnamed protein product [Euphydryas editha]
MVLFWLLVDLKYPDELHDLHSDLPLCPENICVGYFKDENNGDILEKFVGLRSKMYAFTVGEKFVAKAKGVKKSVTKKKL